MNDISQKQSQSSSFLSYAPLGAAAIGTEIAIRSMLKNNKADTFTGSIKNGVKAYTANGREALGSAAKTIKWNKAVDYLKKIDNKKLFAATAAIELILYTAFFKGLSNLFKN